MALRTGSIANLSATLSGKFLAIFALSAVSAACGSAVGGGGGGGGGTSTPAPGGAVGATCNATLFNEGCTSDKASRVKCDGKAWALIATCTGTDVCSATLADPAAPTSATKKLSECKTPVVADVTNSPDTVSGSDTSAGQDMTKAQELSCIQSKCAKEWGACQADVGCKTLATCALACNDDQTCLGNCLKAGTQAAVALLVPIDSCGKTNGCLPAPNTAKCGDGKCDAGENATSCPADCKVASTCGDGKCDSNETPTSCPADCKVASNCGNGKCDPGENASNCAADCKPVDGCGNGKCDPGETPSNCAKDCADVGICGDGICQPTENIEMCPDDCKASVTCGNGKCDPGETAMTCIQDCPNALCCSGKGATCGTIAGCPQSCGVCVGGKTCSGNKCVGGVTPICGNGKCEPPETTQTCAKDCPGGGGTCGDGNCDPATEAADTCPADCGDAETKCIYTACGAEINACQTDPDCNALVGCLTNCDQTDNACIQACAKASNNNAIQLYTTFGKCVQAAACGGGGGTGHFCDTNCGKKGTGCYCDATCKTQGDCCNAAGTGVAGKSCAGSTCADCK